MTSDLLMLVAVALTSAGVILGGLWLCWVVAPR